MFLQSSQAVLSSETMTALAAIFWISLAVLAVGCWALFQLTGLWSHWKKAPGQGIAPESCSLMIVGRHDVEGFERWIHASMSAFPGMEILAVDNQSEDETPNALEALKRKYPRLVVVTIPPSERFWSTRKLALTLAVKAAHGTHALWVDTACALPDDLAAWQRSLTAPMRRGKVVGTFASVTVPKESKLAVRMQALGHNAWAAIRCSLRLPLMASGIPSGMVPVNFAFEIARFFEVKGYLSNMHLDGGEAEFLLGDIAANGHVVPVVHPHAILRRTWVERKDAKMRAHRASVERFAPARYAVLLFLLDAVAVAAGLHMGLLWMTMEDLGYHPAHYPAHVKFVMSQFQAVITLYVLIQIVWTAYATAWSRRLGFGYLGLLSPLWLRIHLLSRILTAWKK